MEGKLTDIKFELKLLYIMINRHLSKKFKLIEINKPNHLIYILTRNMFTEK
jgi:hypothetical protein